MLQMSGHFGESETATDPGAVSTPPAEKLLGVTSTSTRPLKS